jgi:hypothetical protein
VPSPLIERTDDDMVTVPFDAVEIRKVIGRRKWGNVLVKLRAS